MKKKFNIFLLCFVIFAIIGSTGVTIYEHICKEEGKSLSLFIPEGEEAHTNHDEHKHELEASCCHTEKENDDCCTNNIKVYKVEFQYYHAVDFNLPAITLENPKPITTASVLFSKHLKFDYCNRPPPILLEDYQALYQTYIL